MRTERPDDWEALRGALNGWPFVSYLLQDVEASLLMANPEIMKLYASLVRLLRAWRAKPDEGALRPLLLAVNAIAMRQKTTG